MKGPSRSSLRVGSPNALENRTKSADLIRSLHRDSLHHTAELTLVVISRDERIGNEPFGLQMVECDNFSCIQMALGPL